MEANKSLYDVKKRGVGGSEHVKGKGSVKPLKFPASKGKKAGTYKGGQGGHGF